MFRKVVKRCMISQSEKEIYADIAYDAHRRSSEPHAFRHDLNRAGLIVRQRKGGSSLVEYWYGTGGYRKTLCKTTTANND